MEGRNLKQYILAQIFPTHSYRDTIEAIDKADFDGVFFSMEDGLITYKEIELCRKKGLYVETIHLPYHWPFNIIGSLWNRDSCFNQAFEVLKGSIDFASDMQIPTVVLHASSGVSDLFNYRVKQNYIDVAEYCKKKNVRLAIENIRSMFSFDCIMQQLQCFNIGFCFDVGHANAFTKNLYSNCWNKYLENLTCVHFHDNNGDKDSHLLPGMGNIDFRFCSSLISKYSDNNAITWELYYGEHEDVYGRMSPDAFYYKAKERIVHAIGDNQ